MSTEPEDQKEGFEQWVARKIEQLERNLTDLARRTPSPTPVFFVGGQGGSGMPPRVTGNSGGAAYDPMQAPISKKRVLDKMEALADDYYARGQLTRDDDLPRAWIELRNFIEVS